MVRVSQEKKQIFASPWVTYLQHQQVHLQVSSATGDEASDGWWPKFVKVPSLQWQSLLTAAKKQDANAMLEAAVVANEAVAEHVSSLAAVGADVIDMSLTPGGVVRVQLGAELRQGLLTPCVQLFSPVPCFDICVEHRSDAVKCFLNFLPSESVSRPRYDDIESYELLWQQGLGMEACERVLRDVTPSVVSGVTVHWYKTDSDFDTYVALVDLPLDYALQNNFTFALDALTIDSLRRYADLSGFTLESDEERAFVCLRHPNVDIKPSDMSELSRRGTFTWVAHCSLCKVRLSCWRVTSFVASPCCFTPHASCYGVRKTLN